MNTFPSITKKTFVSETVLAKRLRRGLSLAALPANAHDLVIAVVDKLPRGNVATYAQVAFRAGLSRRRARFVGKVLGALPEDNNTPWHRVVSGTRKVAERPGDARQTSRLRKEGVVFVKNRIPLIFFRWPE